MMINYLLILIIALFGNMKHESKLYQASPEFPFIKVGSEWHFTMKTSQNPTNMEIVYKILSIRDDGYIEVENSFVGLFSDVIYWYADKDQFSEIASPDDNSRLTLLKANPVLNDTWGTTVEEEGKTSTITRTVVSINESVQLPDKTYCKDCVKIHETMSSYPGYYKDVWISKTNGIVYIKGKGYEEIDENPPIYFDLEYVLISMSL
jgi:hypothetical protein